MKWRSKPSQPPPREGYALPSRTMQRRTLRRRLLRWWREAVAVLVVIVVTTTAVILINNRENMPTEQAPESWLDRITVSGNVGRVPTLALTSPISVSATKIRQLEVGTGREITEDSPLIVSITTFSGEDGRLITAGSRSIMMVGQANTDDFEATLISGVIGKTEGSRILFLRPVTTDGERTTEINVIDILYSAASGTENPDPGGPLSVEMTDAGPRASHEDGDPPTSLTIQTLIEGDGQQVHADDSVLVQYLSANWDDSVVRGSTWSTGIPEAIDLGDAMPGVRNALVDQRVGTRLAITIPPEQASGDSTLMMVVDIIGTEPRRTDER
ncbi:MAG: peptidylprolyl isomerase [Actinomycetaceae bacterium]|nr:peptidylprolyl isomerase [Actinomycetaceae bacterium]